MTADTEYGTSWKLKPNEWHRVYVESWHKVPEVKAYNKGSFWNRNSGDDVICEQCEFTFTIVWTLCCVWHHPAPLCVFKCTQFNFTIGWTLCCVSQHPVRFPNCHECQVGWGVWLATPQLADVLELAPLPLLGHQSPKTRCIVVHVLVTESHCSMAD